MFDRVLNRSLIYRIKCINIPSIAIIFSFSLHVQEYTDKRSYSNAFEVVTLQSANFCRLNLPDKIK